MTRINLVSPDELTDQHLLAEYRELPRIFGIVKKKISENKKILIGQKYTMGIGHVRFFYDKLFFLEKRFNLIVSECKKRGFNIKYHSYDISDIPNEYKKDFIPNDIDIEISKERLKSKLENKKGFYKKNGKLI